MAHRSSSKQQAPDFVWSEPEAAEQPQEEERPARFSVPPRRALVAGAAAVVLAAGAFGIVDYADRGPSAANAAREIAPSSGISATLANPAASTGALTSSASASGSASGSPSVSPTVSPSATRATAAASSHAAAAATTKTSHASTATTAAAGTEAATDLAIGKTESSSSHTGSDVASNVIDGDPDTYWESQVDSGSFSEWVQVDLEKARTVSKIVMRLPSSWSARTQTIEIYGLATGYNGFVIKSATSYSFNPSTGNEVTITFPALSTRYVQLIMTANSAVSAGQMGEVEIYS